MDTIPILVRNITHLTDARYFSAMGVDWMSIALQNESSSFELWKTLKEWVEGVHIAAEIQSEDEMWWAKVIIEAAPDGIITTHTPAWEIPDSVTLFTEVNSTSAVDWSSNEKIILMVDADMDLKSILQYPSDRIFLQTAWTPDTIQKILKSGYHGGFCFTGEKEDQVGVRDYEEMDEMLGKLKTNN